MSLRWVTGMAALGFILGEVGEGGREKHAASHSFVNSSTFQCQNFYLYKKDANRSPTLRTYTTPNCWISLTLTLHLPETNLRADTWIDLKGHVAFWKTDLGGKSSLLKLIKVQKQERLGFHLIRIKAICKNSSYSIRIRAIGKCRVIGN